MASDIATDTIGVCPLDALPETVARLAPSHLITLTGTELDIATPDSIDRHNHLRLAMNDISAPRDNLIPPDAGHISQLLAFGEAWHAQAAQRNGAPLLIHCWAGISRSPAAAFILLCALNPQADEQTIARLLRQASDTATPNPLMVQIADRLLRREGRMSDAIHTIGRGAHAAHGQFFALPARLATGGGEA